MFDPGTTLIEPLRPVRAHLLLADGVLTIADFDGRTAQGRLVGYLQLDGRGKQALWTADMRALGIDLSHWLRLKRSGRDVAVLCLRQARRAGEGEGLRPLDRRDPRQPQRRRSLPTCATARSRTSSSRCAGLDVAQALGLKLRGDKTLPILCNVVDLDVAGGVARPKVFVHRHHRLDGLRSTARSRSGPRRWTFARSSRRRTSAR